MGKDYPEKCGDCEYTTNCVAPCKVAFKHTRSQGPQRERRSDEAPLLCAEDLPTAYAYRIYNPDDDTISYKVTMDLDEAFKNGMFPLELKPIRELKRGA
jgi:hypothetical protein